MSDNLIPYYELTGCPLLLDKILIEKYFNYDSGFFFEAGANNGISQSNTYILEKFFNWKGILVEPSYWFNSLKTCRENSIHFNCALVSDDWNKSTIKGNFGQKESFAHNLMSLTEQAYIYEPHFSIDVQAKTIKDVINETNFRKFDLISLDCEGSEYSILNGFDFDNHVTKYFVIEIHSKTSNTRLTEINKDNIINLLKNKGYEIEEIIGGQDYIFKNINY